MVATILTLTALLTLAALATPAAAETPADHCIEQVAERPALRKDASRPSRDRNVPYSVPGFPTTITVDVNVFAFALDTEAGQPGATCYKLRR